MSRVSRLRGEIDSTMRRTEKTTRPNEANGLVARMAAAAAIVRGRGAQQSGTSVKPIWFRPSIEHGGAVPGRVESSRVEISLSEFLPSSLNSDWQLS